VSRRFDFTSGDAEALLREAGAVKGESLWNDAWRRLKHIKSAYWSLVFLAAVGVVAFLAPLWPIPSPMALELQLEPQAPVAPWTDFGDHGWQRDAYWDLNVLDRGLQSARAAIFGDWQTGHWLGTDGKGRDLLARIVWGSRISIQVALAATLCSLIIGVLYGAVSGYLGGRVDQLMMRIVDVLYAIPFIFLVIFLITIVNEYRTELADKGVDYMTVFYVVIGAIYWLTMARVVRGQVLSLKNEEFVDAARVLGASTRRIVLVHLVPNVLSVVIVYLTLTIPAVMLFEAFLSFLGLGVEAPKVSWGLLAVDGTEAINPVRTFWWMVLWPAAAMGSTLLALNILGDGLRDALDPKLRGKH
jgi:oligopeptide transport system permease protein